MLAARQKPGVPTTPQVRHREPVHMPPAQHSSQTHLDTLTPRHLSLQSATKQICLTGWYTCSGFRLFYSSTTCKLPSVEENDADPYVDLSSLPERLRSSLV